MRRGWADGGMSCWNAINKNISGTNTSRTNRVSVCVGVKGGGEWMACALETKLKEKGRILIVKNFCGLMNIEKF